MSDFCFFMIVHCIWFVWSMFLAINLNKYIKRSDFWKREYFNIKKRAPDRDLKTGQWKPWK